MQVNDEPIVYSTVGVPDARRVELWEEHCRSELISLNCKLMDTRSLQTKMVSRHTDRIHVARVRGNPHVVERTDEGVRRRPADAISLYLTLRGEAFFYDASGVHTIGAGNLVVSDSDRPFIRGFSGDLEEIDIQIPRTVFKEITGIESLPSSIVMEFTRKKATARALADLFGQSVRETEPRPLDEALGLRLVAQLLTGTTDDLYAVHFATARTFIEEHLSDSSLSAADVARGIGLSERQLSRVFSGEGQSVPRFILGRRLERAKRLLAHSPELSIESVASASGFGSASYFSHLFATHVGERATDFRHRVARRPRGRGAQPS